MFRAEPPLPPPPPPMRVEFQNALPSPDAFRIPVQETSPHPRNSKMTPVVWYGNFLESIIAMEVNIEQYLEIRPFMNSLNGKVIQGNLV